MADAWTARVEWALDGTVTVSVVTVRAGTLRQATWDSLRLVEGSTGGMVTGIEIGRVTAHRRRSEAVDDEPGTDTCNHDER